MIWITTDKNGNIKYLTEKQAIQLIYLGKKEFSDFKLIISCDFT